SESFSNHSYRMAPDYATNDVVLIDSTVTSDTITASSSGAYSALSFLTCSGNGAVTVNYTVHHADSTTETGSFISGDWFFGSGQAVTVNGRLNVQTFAFDNVNAGNPRIYSADVTLTNTNSPVTSIDLSFGSGSGHACIFAVSGSATGATFSPIGITGY